MFISSGHCQCRAVQVAVQTWQWLHGSDSKVRSQRSLCASKRVQSVVGGTPSPRDRDPAHCMKRVYIFTQQFYCLAGTMLDTGACYPCSGPLTDIDGPYWWLLYLPRSGQSKTLFLFGTWHSDFKFCQPYQHWFSSNICDIAIIVRITNGLALAR